MAAAGVVEDVMAWSAMPACDGQSHRAEGRLASAEARRGADDCGPAQVGLQSVKQDWPAAAGSPDAKTQSIPASMGRWASGGPPQSGNAPASQRAAPSKVKNVAGPAQAPTPARAGKGAGKGKGNSRRGANEPPGAAIGGQIAQLKEMGFSEKDARQALAECVWDVNKALDLLFTRGAPMGMGENSDSSAFNAEVTVNPKSVEVVVAREGKGGALSEKTARATSPAASKKAGVVVRNVGNSPLANDSAEHSTTASTASSPRSADLVEKVEKGTVSASSQPSSPQARGDAVASSEADAAATVFENVATAAEAEDVVVSTTPAEPPAAVSPCLHEELPVVGLHEAPRETDVVPAPAVAANDAEAVPPPKKRVERVVRAWAAEGTQLDVKEGDFVRVWSGTMTEHGWIYAEAETDCQKAGWLPDCVLQELPSHQRWMRAGQTMEAVHDTQLGLVEGSWFKVCVDTRTKEGWAYAETMGPTESASEDSGDAPGEVQNCSQAGWAPVCGLEWTD